MLPAPASNRGPGHMTVDVFGTLRSRTELSRRSGPGSGHAGLCPLKHSVRIIQQEQELLDSYPDGTNWLQVSSLDKRPLPMSGGPSTHP
jgi:hypothetical protein